MALTLDCNRQEIFHSKRRGGRPVALLIARLARCREGATALEFAFALPIILLLIIGMFEVAIIMFVNTSVEGGLREAARYGITGQAPDGVSRQQAIVDTIERYTFGFLDMDQAKITFKAYESFNDVGQPEPWTDANGNGVYDDGETYEDINGNGTWDEDRGIDGVGASGEVVLYEIDYSWGLMTPYLANLLGDNGTMNMSASIAVRNEPYDLTAGGGS